MGSFNTTRNRSETLPATMDAAVILVTGGAVRIGREICLSLSESGYTIAIHYNSSENEASDLADIINSRGGKAACFSGDLLDQSMPAKLFEEIKHELGPV